jgi:hypothetical protein
MIDPNTVYELSYLAPSALFALVALVLIWRLARPRRLRAVRVTIRGAAILTGLTILAPALTHVIERRLERRAEESVGAMRSGCVDGCRKGKRSADCLAFCTCAVFELLGGGPAQAKQAWLVAHGVAVGRPDQTFSDKWLEAQSTCEREEAEAANTE